MLSPAAVKAFYDRFGSRQDRQGFYEDPALDDLLAHTDVATARAVVEFGCGTGRFAERLLLQAPTATYLGLDVSTTMVQLARTRLAPSGLRARVQLVEAGGVHLPVPDRSADRIISTYVLDLLPDAAIASFFREAHRVATPDGLLCLVGLTHGVSGIARLVSGLWELTFRLGPVLVGGCRPIRLRSYCDPAAWDVRHDHTVAAWGISSEVLVARPHST